MKLPKKHFSFAVPWPVLVSNLGNRKKIQFRPYPPSPENESVCLFITLGANLKNLRTFLPGQVLGDSNFHEQRNILWLTIFAHFTHRELHLWCCTHSLLLQIMSQKDRKTSWLFKIRKTDQGVKFTTFFVSRTWAPTARLSPECCVHSWWNALLLWASSGILLQSFVFIISL